MALSTITARDKDFEENVRMHFTKGVAALASVASCLLRAHKDSLYTGVRQHIEEAFQEFCQAENLARQKLERVDAVTLEIMDLKKKLTDEQKDLSEHLSALQAQLITLKKVQREIMVNFQGAKYKTLLAQTSQAVAEFEVVTHRDWREAALWTMLIPVVGTVVGGIMAIDAHIDMKNAEKRAASAKEMADKCKEKEEEYRKEAEKYDKQIIAEKKRILQNQRRLSTIEEYRDTLAKLQKEVLDLQEALRRCSHFVGTLASQASAAEITSRYVCIYDSLREQLNDMSNLMLPLLGVESIGVEGLEILSSPAIARAVRKLKHGCESSNIFQFTVVRIVAIMGNLLYGKTFSFHFIFYMLVFLFLADFFSGRYIFCLAEILLHFILTVFFYALRFCLNLMICFILLSIFHYFIKKL